MNEYPKKLRRYPREIYSMQESADALAALLKILLIDKIFIIAISAAGSTALAFFLKYPNCVKKLILDDLNW